MEMTLNERASYIKGYCDGLEIEESSKEGKAIAALVELVSEMALAIEDLEDEIDELRDYIEEIDEDLGTVEEVLCDEEDFECDEDCDCCCDDECDCEDFMEAMCPHCSETICFDNELDPADLICPACGKNFAD